MEQTRTRIQQSGIIRYLIAGGTSYVIELSFLLTCVHILHIDTVLATTIAFIVGLLATFGLQKIVGYQNTDRSTKGISQQAGGYLLLVGINYIFTVFIVSLFSPDILYISRTLALACTTVWNFFVYKIIFKDRTVL